MFKKFNLLRTDSVSDEQSRKLLVFILTNVILGLFSFVMSIINIITAEYILMAVTLVYTLLCLLNTLLVTYNRSLFSILFAIEAISMFCYFIITGVPDGFSVLWLLLVPSFALSIFGKRNGSVFNAVLFLVIIFFFWIPFGRGLLMYNYGSTMMLRFPFIYACLFIIALYIEHVRQSTLEKLYDTEQSYKYFYRHDALTGIFNRYAFNEEIEDMVASDGSTFASVMTFDIDEFKTINDVYGHAAGDKILCVFSGIILENTCGHCVTARWGGDEFLVLMRCSHDPYEIAERIRKTAETHSLVFENKKVRFTVSAGVSQVTNFSESKISEYIRLADKALYASKNNGKNQTTVYKS